MFKLLVMKNTRGKFTAKSNAKIERIENNKSSSFRNSKCRIRITLS
jgi:hypothetical protein